MKSGTILRINICRRLRQLQQIRLTKTAVCDPPNMRVPSQDAKVDLKALIVAVMPIYCFSETINLFFSSFYVFLTS